MISRCQPDEAAQLVSGANAGAVVRSDPVGGGFEVPGKMPTAARPSLPKPATVPTRAVVQMPSLADHAQPRRDEQTAAFLADLKTSVVTATDEELAGSEWTAEQCPWIEYWFSYYSSRTLSEVRAALDRFVPDARGASSAAEYSGPLAVRVKASIRRWRATGEIDARAATATQGDAELVARTSSLSGGERPTASAAIASTLGTSQARIHTGSTANRLAERAGALAYTVGDHIVYSNAAPRPGSVAGDALLAHELAHTRQQRSSSGSSSVASSEANADRAVAHAAASQLGMRGMLGRAWSAVAAPLGLQRCSNKKSNDDEIAADKLELAGVAKVIDAPHQDFTTLAAAITKREALEHWISTLSGGHGKRTGTQSHEPGLPGCNCTTYVVLVLKEAFEKAGRAADWKKVIDRTHELTGSSDTNGVELQSALRGQLGWKAIFWAPDPLYPGYQRHPRAYDHAPDGTSFVPDTENEERYKLATRADKPVYRISPGKKSDDDLRISQSVINYAPEKAGRSITIAGGDSTTVKDTTGLAKLQRLPFGVLTARGGTHMALIVNGVVYEIHWDRESDAIDLYMRTPLELWGWGSGIIVAPAEDVDKAFK